MPAPELETFETVEDVRSYMNTFKGSKTYGWEHLQLCLNEQVELEVLTAPEPEVVPEPDPIPEL